MADLSDVIDAVTTLLWSAFYPDGPGTQSVLGTMAVKVKPGWPLAADLDKEVGGVKDMVSLMDRGVYVSVFAPPNLERATTRAMPQWLAVEPPSKTLTVSLADRTVTFGGTVAVPQNVGVLVGNVAVSYPVQAADTLPTIAAQVAALLTAQGVPASATGPALTIPVGGAIIARIGSTRTLAKEVERSQRQIMTTVWAPTPALRTAAGRIVRARLADTSDLPGCHNRFVPLCDGSAAWVVYNATNDWDQDQRAGLYRRDISHWFEFGEYAVTSATEIVVSEARITAAIPPYDPLAPSLSTFA